MNFVSGRSIPALEAINTNACETNPYYKSAFSIYEQLLNKVVAFITANAPVYSLEISHYHLTAQGVQYDNSDPNFFYLNANYVPKGSTGRGRMKTLTSFRLTAELQYILVTEGWAMSGSDANITFTVPIKKNSIRY